jgi:hypothetical protein
VDPPGGDLAATVHDHRMFPPQEVASDLDAAIGRVGAARADVEAHALTFRREEPAIRGWLGTGGVSPTSEMRW